MNVEQWIQATLTPLLESEPDPAALPAEAQVIVFAADTDRTQSYVFESDKLPEIRGASRQIAELNEDTVVIGHLKKLGLDERCLLYAGGGSVLALLPSEAVAEALEQRLTKAYADQTVIATVSCAYETFAAGELIGSQRPVLSSSLPKDMLNTFYGQEGNYPTQFGRIVSLIAFKLRRRKQQKKALPFIELMPFARRCESCYTRPASEVVREEDLVCSICKKKWEAGKGEKRSYWPEVLGPYFKDNYEVDTGEIQYPKDIETLTGDSAVALVYADGDSIGQHLHRLSTPHDYKNFSQALTKSAQGAVCQAIYEAGLTLKGEANWEVITIGGDDVLILIPAKAALGFSILLSEGFSTLMDEKWGHPGMRMSVGFAVGKVKTPVSLLYEGARSSLKNAKGRARETGQACVDWHNITKEGHPPLGARPKRHTRLSERELTSGRPYTLTDARKLQSSVNEAMEAQVSSQLYGIAAELQMSAARGNLYYFYQRARMRHLREFFVSIEDTWRSEPDLFPWLTREEDQYTIFLDILDLL